MTDEIETEVETKKWLTALEASKIADVSIMSISEWVKKGKFNDTEIVRQGEFYRLSREGLERVIAERSIARKSRQVAFPTTPEYIASELSKAGGLERTCKAGGMTWPLTEVFWHKDNAKYMNGFNTRCRLCRNGKSCSIYLNPGESHPQEVQKEVQKSRLAAQSVLLIAGDVELVNEIKNKLEALPGFISVKEVPARLNKIRLLALYDQQAVDSYCKTREDFFNDPSIASWWSYSG